MSIWDSVTHAGGQAWDWLTHPPEHVEGHYAGTMPDSDGPFAYAGSERDRHGNIQGFSAGAGMHAGQGAGPGSPGPQGGSLDFAEAQGHFGRWNEDGHTTTGLSVEGGALRVGVDGYTSKFGDNRAGGEGHIGFGSAALSVSDSDFNVGVGIDGVGGSGYRETELAHGGVNRHRDEGGLAVGFGGSLRLHYGDADRDGIRELGIGAGIGEHSSFYQESEEWGRNLDRATRWIAGQPAGHDRKFDRY